MPPKSKCERLASWSARLGATWLLERLPDRPQLLVLNYHRIGDPAGTPYDPDVFTCTTAELDSQLACLKRRFQIVPLEEAVAFVHGQTRFRGTRILITFDDGYIDNYSEAFPVLRAHQVPAVFYLPTSFVGTANLPWWDVIAYILKGSRRRQFQLDYPEPAAFDLDRTAFLKVLRGVLSLYKQPATVDRDRFLASLEQACDSAAPGPNAERCFLSWDEARQMLAGGMAFGSHTHNHEILTKLDAAGQAVELERSRTILTGNLGCPIETLSYPVGLPNTFSAQTQAAARRLGYRAAFSFYGGLNAPGSTNPYDVRRHSMGPDSLHLLRLRTAVGAISGQRLILMD